MGYENGRNILCIDGLRVFSGSELSVCNFPVWAQVLHQLTLSTIDNFLHLSFYSLYSRGYIVGVVFWWNWKKTEWINANRSASCSSTPPPFRGRLSRYVKKPDRGNNQRSWTLHCRNRTSGLRAFWGLIWKFRQRQSVNVRVPRPPR